MQEEEEKDIRQYMQAAVDGDQQAFSYIFKKLYSPLFRYIYVRTGSRVEAEDLTQQVFLNAYRALPRFKLRPQPPQAFFFRIAKNALIDFYRKKKAVPLDEFLTETLRSTENTEEKVELIQEMEKVNEALETLTEEQAQVVTLRFMGELSHDEVAKIINKKPEAVRALQSRALKALRDKLA